MRAAVVAMVVAASLAGCAGSWRRIDVRDVNREAPEELFAVTENDAYVLEHAHVDNNVLRGHIVRSWRLTRPASVNAHDNRNPDDISADASWREGRFGNDVEVHIENLHVATAQSQSLAPRLAGAVILCALVGVVFYGAIHHPL